MCLNSDFVKKLDIPIILVIKNKLGCINHTLLTIEMIESLKLNLKLIIFNRFNKEDDSHFEIKGLFVKNYDIYNWQGQDFHPEFKKNYNARITRSRDNCKWNKAIYRKSND